MNTQQGEHNIIAGHATKMEHFLIFLKRQPLSHGCTHFVNVLKVKPGIERSDGQIQI